MDKTATGGASLRKDGVVFFYLTGDLDVDTLRPVLLQVNEYIEQQKAKGLRNQVIADATQLESVQVEARKHGVEWLKTADYDKVSVYGSSVFMKYLVNMYVRLIGGKMHYSESEDEALKWLNQE